MTQQPSQLSQPSQPTKIPMGQPIQWSDTDLDALSQISDADLLLAIAMWKRDIPVPSLRDLLDAEKTDTSGQGGVSGRF